MPGKLNFQNRRVVRYGSALAAVGASMLLRLALTAWVGPDLPTYITFYPAVMVVALIGGFGPGLLATVATALVVDYTLLDPIGQLGVANTADVVGVALFSGMGVFMSVVAELYRRARQGVAARDTEFFRRAGVEPLPRSARQGLLLNAGLAVSLALLAAAGWQSLRHLAATAEADRRTAQTYATIQNSLQLLSTLKDVETGQRGYLLTGDEKYLEPYRAGLGRAATNLAGLKQLTVDNTNQQQRLAELEPLIRQKLAEVQASIELRRTQGFQAALAMVASDKGKVLMDEIRQRLAGIQAEEQVLLQQRTVQRDAAARRTLQALVAGGILSLLLLVSVFLFLKVENTRRRQAEAELRRHEKDLQGVVAARTADLSQANQTLRQQREWLSVTLSSIGDAVLAADTAGRITFVNPIAETLTGWTAKEALGQPVQTVFRTVNEDTRAPGEDIVARVLREGGVITLANHTDLITRDGREVPIEDSAAPIKDSAGTICGVVLVFHDVAEKRKVQAAMRESQRQNELLAGVIERSSQAFGMGYPDGRLGLINRAFEQLTGYSAEELRTMDWARALTPLEWREIERQKLEELHATGKPVRYEKEYLRKDGSRVPIELLVHLARDSKGKPEYYFSFLSDITERKRGEEALRESERQFRTLADSIPNLAWWANSDGYITWYNQRWYEYTGTTPQQMEGWGWQSVHDPQALPAVLERWRLSIATGHPFDMTFPLRGADGVFRPFLTRVMPLKDVQGRVRQWFGTNTDISEQKWVEERMSLLSGAVEAAASGIAVTDRGGKILWVNPAFTKLTDYTAAEAIGQNPRVLKSGQHPPEFYRAMWETLLRGEVWQGELVNKRKDGALYSEEMTITPLRIGGQEISHFIAIKQDITERKRAEAAVHQLNAALEQRVADLQAANEEVRASRRSALSLAEDALEARTEAERANSELKRANDSLATSRHAAINLMDDAVWARRQAEQATAESRSAAEQRRLALEAADLGAWDYQFQIGAVFWDERCREMWGIPQAETINYAEAIAGIHPEDRAGVDEAVQQALAGKDGGAYHREFRIIWPDGSAHWIASHGRVYFEGEGEQRRAIRFVGANQEITERKLREEQLQTLNRTLKAHAKSDQALLRVQSEGEFVEAVCRIVVEDCGHTMVWVGFAEEDEGRTVRPVAQAGFEAGYLETLRITWADTERGRGPTGTAIRTGQPRLCRNMLTDPEFAPWRTEAIKRGYASSLVLPLLADGRAFGALSIYSRQPDGFSNDEVTLLTELAGDLSYGIAALRLREAKVRAEAAQRQSEERYRGLVELSPEAVFINRNGRIVLVNPAALQLFGASSEEQLLGKSPFEVFHRESHAVMRERISKVLAGQRVPVIEEKIVRLDGIEVDVEVVAALVMDQGERAILVLLRDITERKQAEAALRHTADDLQRSNRDLEQFAYVASHDLQEPLRAVGGYVKLLQHRFPDKLDGKARDYIAGAFDGATRMERLIGDLLAYSRVGTRGGAFDSSNLDVVLNLALRNLESGIAASQATITHDQLPTLPVDATQMMQLFQNLIGNGLKFHSEAPPRIHVGALKQEGRWVFSVRDNGIGIDPQYYEKIFQIFQRLHTRKDYPGTGIGLAVCKKIVERHDGKIWVESQPGQGSTFYFSLPEAASK